jgi:hypothetical protein
MNSFLFFQRKNGKSDDKTGPRNGFWPNRRLQGIIDNTKQADQRRLTNLSKKPISRKHKKYFVKRKLN